MTFSMEWALAATLAGMLLGTEEANANHSGWFKAIDNADAWALLPKRVQGKAEVLPNWALMLSSSLPTTTAAMLELDSVQRTKNTLEPRLRAKIRWVAARANGCEYTKAYAAADLVRAGGSQKELDTIAQAPSSLPEQEQLLYRFTRQLCQESYAITDEQVAKLLEIHGATDLSGIVLLVAYSNFQDRLMLGLGVELEAEGPLAPSTVKFDWESLKSEPVSVPKREPLGGTNNSAAVPALVPDAEWSALGADELAARLESQKDRQSRIPVMDPKEVEKFVWPHLYSPQAATEIVWHNVTFGYQPDLVNSWFFALRRFREESGYVGNFRQTAFWVVTRATQCNYCMGHTQMLMEIVGMKENEVAGLVRTLASGDWSSFPDGQRAILHFARKITKTPGFVTREDVDELVAQVGEVATMDAIWHLCWCNFMVRVSNAFQIPLERENVFWHLHGKTPPAPTPPAPGH